MVGINFPDIAASSQSTCHSSPMKAKRIIIVGAKACIYIHDAFSPALVRSIHSQKGQEEATGSLVNVVVQQDHYCHHKSTDTKSRHPLRLRRESDALSHVRLFIII